MVSAVSGSTLVGSWDPPSPEHRNGEILRYVVNITLTARGGTQVTNGEQRTLYTATTNLTVGSLHPHYTYFYSVAAENSVGTGPSTMTPIMMPEAGKRSRDEAESANRRFRAHIVHRNITKILPLLLTRIIFATQSFFGCLFQHPFTNGYTISVCSSLGSPARIFCGSPRPQNPGAVMGAPRRRTPKRHHPRLQHHSPCTRWSQGDEHNGDKMGGDESAPLLHLSMLSTGSNRGRRSFS